MDLVYPKRKPGLTPHCVQAGFCMCAFVLVKCANRICNILFDFKIAIFPRKGYDNTIKF